MAKIVKKFSSGMSNIGTLTDSDELMLKKTGEETSDYTTLSAVKDHVVNSQENENFVEEKTEKKVSVVGEQGFTDEEKQQGRENIGAFASEDVVGELGNDPTKVINQQKVSEEFALKENKENKQNHLTADGTGQKIPTVDAVNAGLLDYAKLLVGKNQFNKNDSGCQLGYYIDYTTGIAHTNAAYNATGFIPILPSTNYSFSGQGQTAFYDANKTYISGANLGFTNPLTSPENAAYVRCSVNVAGWSLFQVEVGNTPTTFESYYKKLPGTEILENSISGSKLLASSISKEKTDFFIVGKNKFNINDADCKLGYYSSSVDGGIYENAAYNVTGYIPVTSGQEYTVSLGMQISFLNANKVFIGGVNGSGAAPYTLTIPANAVYMRCSVLLAYWNLFQVELGTSATEYEAYGYYLNPLYIKQVTNDIAMPAKLYMLSAIQNNLFIEPIIKRWRPYNESVRFSGTASYSRRLQRVASISAPVDNATVITSLINHDTFSTLKTKTSNIVLGTKSVGATEIAVSIIGDSYTNSGFFKDALLDKGYCPNIKMIGLRKVTGEVGQYDEGRGGWTLADYMTVKTDSNNLNPFFQPNSTFLYWGSTGFWINAWKVFRGTAGSGAEPNYSAGRYDDYLSLFDETTGLKITPTTNDIMYDSSAASYKVWNGSAWVTTSYETYSWSFNYAKYLSMWGLTSPAILSIMLGLNDFRDNTYPENISFSTWNANMNLVKDSYLAAVPTGKFVICIPASTCGILDNESSAFTIKQNAAMWMLRKNIIDVYDAREEESIYLVDVGITVDNYTGYNFSSDANQIKPYSDYEGTDLINVQSGNPHPYPNYPTMGIPLAAFIQKYR